MGGGRLTGGGDVCCDVAMTGKAGGCVGTTGNAGVCGWADVGNGGGPIRGAGASTLATAWPQAGQNRALCPSLVPHFAQNIRTP